RCMARVAWMLPRALGGHCETHTLLAQPADLLLIALDCIWCGDLHPMRAVRGDIALGDDAETNQQVHYVVSQACGRDRELNTRTTCRRIHRAVAAHQHTEELGKVGATPCPDASRETLLLRQLAPHPKFIQPLCERIARCFHTSYSGPGYNVGDLVVAYGTIGE